MLICCRALLSPDSCLLDKYCGKRTNHYDVPHATSVSDDWVFLCCGLFELERWNVCHHSCVDIHMTFQTTASQVWNSFLWHLSQKLYFYCRLCFSSWMCAFVSSTFCLSHLLFDLYYPILFTNACHWISWGSELSSAIPFF